MHSLTVRCCLLLTLAACERGDKSAPADPAAGDTPRAAAKPANPPPPAAPTAIQPTGPRAAFQQAALDLAARTQRRVVAWGTIADVDLPGEPRSPVARLVSVAAGGSETAAYLFDDGSGLWLITYRLSGGKDVSLFADRVGSPAWTDGDDHGVTIGAERADTYENVHLYLPAVYVVAEHRWRAQGVEGSKRFTHDGNCKSGCLGVDEFPARSKGLVDAIATVGPATSIDDLIGPAASASPGSEAFRKVAGEVAAGLGIGVRNWGAQPLDPTNKLYRIARMDAVGSKRAAALIELEPGQLWLATYIYPEGATESNVGIALTAPPTWWVHLRTPWLDLSTQWLGAGVGADYQGGSEGVLVALRDGALVVLEHGYAAGSGTSKEEHGTQKFATYDRCDQPCPALKGFATRRMELKLVGPADSAAALLRMVGP